MVRVQFNKYFVAGWAEGFTTATEIMRFVDWDSAQKWAALVTEKVDVDYVVQNLVNLETFETAEI